MGLQEFIHRVHITRDTPEIWKWCTDNVAVGTWGALFPPNGPTATYCFEREDDVVVFKINHGHK
jgi:hypothetical protein